MVAVLIFLGWKYVWVVLDDPSENRMLFGFFDCKKHFDWYEYKGLPVSDIICAFYTNETVLEILGVFDFRHHSAVAVTPLLKQNILVFLCDLRVYLLLC